MRHPSFCAVCDLLRRVDGVRALAGVCSLSLREGYDITRSRETEDSAADSTLETGFDALTTWAMTPCMQQEEAVRGAGKSFLACM